MPPSPPRAGRAHSAALSLGYFCTIISTIFDCSFSLFNSVPKMILLKNNFIITNLYYGLFYWRYFSLEDQKHKKKALNGVINWHEYFKNRYILFLWV